MSASPGEADDGTRNSFKLNLSLFDSDGLPWCSRLVWGWLFILSAITGFFGAILLGVYLGLWLKTKRRSLVALYAYLVLAILYIAGFVPLPRFVPHATVETVIAIVALATWLGAAYVVRYEVMRYYSVREKASFRISPVLTGLLSVWYISGLLHADFPLDESGQTAPGILKLTV